MEQNKTIRILIVEPCKNPRPVTIPHTLKDLQNVVGGYIQAIYPWEDRVALVCDEEGLIKRAPPNRMINEHTIITGTFFICGLGEEDFTDLPDDLMEKYENMFHWPQVFVRSHNGFSVFTIGLQKEG